ncbi:ribose 5-phosphate isomerase B [Planctomycetales bacterium]|nr:ribose 5-phosphate isomerase B [Planctomycetales bacterium]
MGSIPIKIMLGSDQRGSALFNFVVKQLKDDSRYEISFIDGYETECLDYPYVAANISAAVSAGKVRFGIVVGGTGLGMCVTANKFPGVRAALCHNEVDTELSRKHNNANVLCLAGDMLGERACAAIVNKWLSTEFSGGRHQKRLDIINAIERDNLKKRSRVAELAMC